MAQPPGARLGIVANVFEPEWDAEQDRAPFTWKRARLGHQAGSQKLGASLYELAPGGSSFPLHIHHANEELLLVLTGTPTLRTIDAERELAPGELVACPTGRSGAHRLDNRTDEPVQVLIMSTMIAPELAEYPDSGKIWTKSSPPGGEVGPDDVGLIARFEDKVDYFEGEAD